MEYIKKATQLLFSFFDRYKNGVSHNAITISIMVVVVAIEMITGIENMPMKAKVLKKQFSKQLHNMVDRLFLNHNLSGYFSFNLFYIQHITYKEHYHTS